jgi:hypothetical protein
VSGVFCLPFFVAFTRRRPYPRAVRQRWPNGATTIGVAVNARLTSFIAAHFVFNAGPVFPISLKKNGLKDFKDQLF